MRGPVIHSTRDTVRLPTMLERTTTRSLPLLNRAADLAPATQACCGVCRTCMTTNLLGMAVAGLAVVGVALRRILLR
jgi:hypothetical protein